MSLISHRHGKSKVRVARVWRDGAKHTLMEWEVGVMLESDMAHAYLAGSNEGMTATDTIKNIVYLVAKSLPSPSPPEIFGMRLAAHFLDKYEKVTKADITIEAIPWDRVNMNGVEHNHGFACTGSEIRLAEVSQSRGDTPAKIVSGFRNLKILKTTQSGFEGFLQDEFTRLPETSERILASSVTCKWTHKPESHPDYDEQYESGKKSLLQRFFGSPKMGVYSPSVQFTLHQMGLGLLESLPYVDSVYLSMPNIHFLPCNPVTAEFEDDVYIPTSEPFGNIEATIVRNNQDGH